MLKYFTWMKLNFHHEILCWILFYRYCVKFILEKNIISCYQIFQVQKLQFIPNVFYSTWNLLSEKEENIRFPYQFHFGNWFDNDDEVKHRQFFLIGTLTQSSNISKSYFSCVVVHWKCFGCSYSIQRLYFWWFRWERNIFCLWS